jgi:hypothetical protein
MRLTLSLVALLIIAIPVPSFAQHQHAPASATVDFGVLPLVPLGLPPCAQLAAPQPAGVPTIGGPLDPCAYRIHVLTPDEVSVQKGGEVSFQIHGGGHGFAIYEVSKGTTRKDIGPQLCDGTDPATVPAPPGTALTCNLSATNANAQHIVSDAKGDVVLVAETGTTTHPNNRVWSEPGRLMSAGAHQFLNGGTIPAGATSNGQILTYQFLKTGRYLVLCINRTHFLNDWMFGFVDVHE